MKTIRRWEATVGVANVLMLKDKTIYEFPVSNSNAFNKKFNIASSIDVNQTLNYQFSGTVPVSMEEGYYYMAVCATRNDYAVGNRHCMVYDQPIFIGEALPTGVNKKHNDSEKILIVYPNPAQGFIFVKINKKALSYRLIANDGRMINMEADNQLISTAGIAKGLYILQVVTEEGVYSEKLIIE